MKNIGIHFVGLKSCKIVILGIAKSAVNVETGVNGTVKTATDVHMVSVFLASIVETQVHIRIINKMYRAR